MTKDEALDLALEALQEVYWSSRSAKHDEAITAIQQALAEPVQEPVQEPVAWIWKYANGEEEVVFVPPRHVDASHVDAPSTITPLYTTPPAQEFVCSTGLCRFTLTQTNVGIGERGMEAYEAAKKRGWVGISDERLMEMSKQEPEKRELVELTDEEIDVIKPFADGYEHREYARVIEAKLKEKNT